MEDDRFVRQNKIISQEELSKQRVLIVGLGATGKTVAEMLACMGVTNIVICDFDQVEIHNITTQGYNESDLDKYKAHVVAENIIRINSRCNVEIILNKKNIPDRWRPGYFKQHDITCVFLCVDSMKIRDLIFQFFKDSVQAIFDGRISGEQIRLVNSFDEASKAHFPSTIIPDDQAEQDGCHGVRMYRPSAMIAAGLICQGFSSHVMGRPVYMDRMFALPSSELYPTFG